MADSVRRKRVVILGGGFGGAYCAQRLEKLARREPIDVVLIDRRNYFIFYPLLVEAGTGSLEPRHAVVSLRSFCRRTRLVMAEVTSVDATRGEVVVTLTGTTRRKRIPYDHLVLALGSVTNMPPIPGLREHGFELKSIGDSVALRDRAIQMLEIANQVEDPEERRALLRFTIVGGSYTGVEAAGELHAFMRRAARQYENIRPRDIEFLLVEYAGRILNTLDEGLSDYALRTLRDRGIRVALNSSLKSLSLDRCTLSNGEEVPTHTVVWCAGITPSPLLKSLPFERNERGALVAERDLRLRGQENVWGIGDCAANPGPDGQHYPATAQHAVQQGKHLADNIARMIRGEKTLPCDIKSQGVLAAYGCYQAVARVGPFRVSGFPAWWLWRTVYLMKMPTLSRKVRVALDWTLDLFFPSDVVQLGVHRVERPSNSSE